MSPVPSIRLPRLRQTPLATVLLCATLALGGCSSRLGSFTGSLTDIGRSSAPPAGPGDMGDLARRYDARPGEKQPSLAYAERLRANGQHAQAVAVLQRAAVKNVGDREVAAAYGKALADVGRFAEAMQVLSQAHTTDRPDWRVLSTQGAISDQMGKHDRAREFYDQALRIAPNDPTVLTNLALSHVLTRDLAKAEELLRLAARQPKASERVRANLALVQSLRAQAGRSAQTPERKTAKPLPLAPTKTKAPQRG